MKEMLMVIAIINFIMLFIQFYKKRTLVELGIAILQMFLIQYSALYLV